MKTDMSRRRLSTLCRRALLSCLMSMALSAAAAGRVDERPVENTVEAHQPAAAGTATVTATEDSSAGAIITPSASVATAPRVRAGPSVEMITGGNSADGAARVGRLPILE